MRRSALLLFVVIGLICVACGSRISESQFDRLVVEGADPDLGLSPEGEGGGDGPGATGGDLSGVTGGDGGSGSGGVTGSGASTGATGGSGSSGAASTGSATGAGSTGTTSTTATTGSGTATTGTTDGGSTTTGSTTGTTSGTTSGTTATTGSGTSGTSGTSTSGSSGSTTTSGTSGSGSSGSGTSGTNGSGSSGTDGGSSTDGSGTTGNQTPNFASDTGVTADSIKLGSIFSKGGPLGPWAFTGMYYGANAYFELLNYRGGVNGRTVSLVPCDDAEDQERNQQCVEELIDNQEVFALVGTATRAYAGAEYVAESGVPDIGGQPIGNDYWTWPIHFAIRGSEYPRDGNVGHDGKLYGQTLQHRWMRDNVGVTKAVVIYYDIPPSNTYGPHLVDGLNEEGIEAYGQQVNFAVPNWDSVVADMESRGVDGIWDAIDANGNAGICEAMHDAGFTVKAKVHNVNGWTREVRNFPDECRATLYATAESRPNGDLSHDGVVEFRQTIQALYGEEYDANLHQWAFEGWVAAKLITEGIASMGADVTRDGLIDWMNSHDAWDGDGLTVPLQWQPVDFEAAGSGTECITMAKWDDGEQNFLPVATVPYCEDDVPWLPYSPAQ